MGGNYYSNEVLEYSCDFFLTKQTEKNFDYRNPPFLSDVFSTWWSYFSDLSDYESEYMCDGIMCCTFTHN